MMPDMTAMRPGRVRTHAAHRGWGGGARSGRRAPLLTALLLCVAMLGGCGSSGGGGVIGPPLGGAQVLGSGTYGVGGLSWDYLLLRLDNSDGGYSYAQWFPPPKGAVGPAVVLTRPYDGIDWTGEDVDRRWAARPDGCYPDSEQPSYDPRTSSVVCYFHATPHDIGNEAYLYLLNDTGVLAVFGRFYAGGSAWNDVQDMVAGLRFLATQDNVDRARVGIEGVSWGGFEAAYGLAYAPPELTPRAAVARAPAIDFVRLVEHVDMTLPAAVTSAAKLEQYQAFYDPYLRRVFAAAGGRPTDPGADYSRFVAPALAARLSSSLLIAHDDWDTLLPARISRDFVAAAPGYSQGLWYQHPTPVDYENMILGHGPWGSESGFSSVTTLSMGFMLTRVGGATQTLFIPYEQSVLLAYLRGVRDHQQRGLDVAWLAPLLLDLTDTRVSMVEMSINSVILPKPGARLVAEGLNLVWGTALTPSTVADYLRANGLPP